MEMSLNTKLEVAIEILASKIADMSNKGYTIDDEEMKTLIKERIQMYAGDEDVINKIINVYGPEVKKRYEGQNLDLSR